MNISYIQLTKSHSTIISLTILYYAINVILYIWILKSYTTYVNTRLYVKIKCKKENNKNIIKGEKTDDSPPRV